MTSLERDNWTIELSWVKAHVGIAGNDLADQLAKAAASDSEAQITFNRIPISTLLSEIEEEAIQKMAEGMGRGNESCNNKRVLSRSAGQAKIKNSNKPSIHSDGNRPRENQSLSPSF